MKTNHRILVAIVTTCVLRPAAAHHSLAEYNDDAVVEAVGTVVDVLWRNPHVRLTISTEDFDGDPQVWELEGMGVMRLDRAGIQRDLVGVGTTVRFAGNPSRRRSRHMYVTNVLMPDGQEILLRTSAEPRWTDDIDDVVSIRRSAITPEQAAADRPNGIFRVWVPAGNRPPSWAADPPLTAAAKAARDAYDALTDDPLLTCTPPGMPRVIARSGGHPIRFVERDGNIVLENEYFGLDRVIHMDPEIDLSRLPPAPLGHSTGRWEGSSLVVTTTGIDWPWFQLYGLEGVPQSPAMRIVERFTPNAAVDELRYDLSATDPAIFTETVVAENYVTFRWEPGLEFLPYECITRP
jgi:hypothetical protein